MTKFTKGAEMIKVGVIIKYNIYLTMILVKKKIPLRGELSTPIFYL